MTEKNYFASNLRYLRQKKNMEQLELAELLKRKSSSSISEWEKGKYKPKAGILSDIASIFNVTLTDLMEKDLTLRTSISIVPKSETLPSTLQKITDTSSELEPKRQLVVLNTAENELREQKALAISKNTEKPQIIYYTYDYYDHPASAGTGQYLNDVQVEQIDLPVDYDADFVVPIYGNSMEPEFHSGDYVFVKLSVDLSDGDIGVFEYYGDAYIKQLLINEDGAFLHSLNEEEYEDIPIDTDSDFRIIGKILGRYRED